MTQRSEDKVMVSLVIYSTRCDLEWVIFSTVKLPLRFETICVQDTSPHEWLVSNLAGSKIFTMEIHQQATQVCKEEQLIARYWMMHRTRVHCKRPAETCSRIRTRGFIAARSPNEDPFRVLWPFWDSVCESTGSIGSSFDARFYSTVLSIQFPGTRVVLCPGRFSRKESDIYRATACSWASSYWKKEDKTNVFTRSDQLCYLGWELLLSWTYLTN